MMFKWLAAVAAVVVVAVPGVAAASDINDGVTEEQMFGSGSAGSLSPMPDCPKLTYFSFEESTCLPTSSPLPQGTVALATDGTCPVSEDLETAFTTSAEMKTLLECILPKAIDWLSYEYVDASLVTPAEWGSQSGTLLPLDFIYVPAGIAVEELEGQFQHCGGYDSASALHYCPQDGNIYLGEELLWFTYNEFGDADMWGSISHEMGHRIQHVAGGMKADPAVPNEEIPIENQADCFSGAFMDFAARYGYIDVSVTGDDIVDLFSGLFTIGEADSGQRTHGTIDQRIRAFFVGYNSDDSSGVFECDFYLTDVTIIPATFLEDTQTPGADSTTVPAAATPTTVAPATPTTAPAAPTTAPASPTTAPAAPTTAPAAPTTVPGSTGVAEATTEINTVDGVVAFTCSDILSIGDEPVECPDSFQPLFNDIVANDPVAFNTYIYDHDLGFFSTQEVNVPQTAFVGFWACLAMASQNPYTEYDTDIRDFFPAANPADTQRAWDTAALVLCPFLTQ